MSGAVKDFEACVAVILPAHLLQQLRAGCEGDFIQGKAFAIQLLFEILRERARIEYFTSRETGAIIATPHNYSGTKHILARASLLQQCPETHIDVDSAGLCFALLVKCDWRGRSYQMKIRR